MFKFRSILWEFKLLKFIDEARVFRKALHGSTRSICVHQFFYVPAAGGPEVRDLRDQKLQSGVLVLDGV